MTIFIRARGVEGFEHKLLGWGGDFEPDMSGLHLSSNSYLVECT